MLYSLFYSKFQRVLMIFTIITALFMSFLPVAYAIPGESNDLPGNISNLGWVDLSATVPEDFTGSVSVHFKNTADDSYYSIESFVLNNFKNSIQVPLGTYVVEAVSTSEDPFLYNVTCNPKEFELTNSFSLQVTVVKNEAGMAFLEGDVDVPDTKAEPTSEIVKDNDPKHEIIVENQKTETEEPVKTEKDVSEEKDSNVSEEPEKEGRSFWQEILIRVIGILVFAAIFFCIYFLSRRKYH